MPPRATPPGRGSFGGVYTEPVEVLRTSLGVALSWLSDAREDLEQGALAGTVAANACPELVEGLVLSLSKGLS